MSLPLLFTAALLGVYLLGSLASSVSAMALNHYQESERARVALDKLQRLVPAVLSTFAPAASVARPDDRLVVNVAADQTIRVLTLLLPLGERDLQRGVFAEEFDELVSDRNWKAKVAYFARLAVSVLRMRRALRSSRRKEMSS